MVNIAIPSRNHMETLRSNFEYHQILGIVKRTNFYSQCHEIPSATLSNFWQPYGMHQIPLDTFSNPEYLNYLLLKLFLQQTRSRQWRPHTICSRASIVFIRRNSAKTQIYLQLYCWQPKYRQIPRYLTAFGLQTSNTEYC